MKKLIFAAALFLSLGANAYNDWSCTANDSGTEEHYGGHEGFGPTEGDARRDAIRTCRYQHGSCYIQSCRYLGGGGGGGYPPPGGGYPPPGGGGGRPYPPPGGGGGRPYPPPGGGGGIGDYNLSGTYSIHWDRWDATMSINDNGGRLTGQIYGNGHDTRQCEGYKRGTEFSFRCSFYNNNERRYITDDYQGTIDYRGRSTYISGYFVNQDNFRAQFYAQKY